jgi:hypothetical protein
LPSSSAPALPCPPASPTSSATAPSSVSTFTVNVREGSDELVMQMGDRCVFRRRRPPVPAEAGRSFRPEAGHPFRVKAAIGAKRRWAGSRLATWPGCSRRSSPPSSL